jgi:hypothetical protein
VRRAAAFATALIAITLMSGAMRPAFASDPGSRQWNAKRVKLWMAVCPASAPTFAGFKSAARRAGFTEQGNGTFNYEDSEIFVSLQRKRNKCNCWFTFGSDKPQMAAEMLVGAMSRAFGSKFQPDEDPKSIGTLQTANGELNLNIRTWKQHGGDWLGVEMGSRKRCPA